MINWKMSLKKFSVMLSLVLLTLLASSCSSMITVAPSTTPITENDTYTKLDYSVGRSYGFLILGMIPIFRDDPVGAATKSAIESSGGNALIEVAVEENVIPLVIFHMYWTTVEGTAVLVEHGGRVVE